MKNKKYFTSDDSFLSLFSNKMKEANKMHFTPLSVAKKASEFLCTSHGNKILDIGSGIGKFCFQGAVQYATHTFYGIEQRQDLHDEANKTNELLQLKNVVFEHKNIDKIVLKNYDHFYFFNSFHENIEEDKMDNEVEFSSSLYHYYNAFLYKQFMQLPQGTRIATFHTLPDIIPPKFELIETHFDESLCFYEKLG